MDEFLTIYYVALRRIFLKLPPLVSLTSEMYVGIILFFHYPDFKQKSEFCHSNPKGIVVINIALNFPGVEMKQARSIRSMNIITK